MKGIILIQDDSGGECINSAVSIAQQKVPSRSTLNAGTQREREREGGRERERVILMNV